MSRLLDRLRRRRRGDGPAFADNGQSPARAAEGQKPATAVGRAVVLDALSGGRPAAPWYRRRLPCVLAVLGLATILLYITAVRGRPSADRSTSQPRLTPASASPVTTPTAGVQERVADTHPSDAPAPAPVRASAPRDVTGRRTPSRPNQARPMAPADAPAAGEASAPLVVAGPPAADSSREDERFRRALRYQQTGDVENAIAEYRALLKANGLNAQAHNNLGLLYQGKGLSEDATGEFRRAIAIDPAYAKARNNLGVGLLRAGNVEAAASQFRRVLSADPDNQDAMINLALSQRAGGHSDEARETLIRAIEINDRSAVAHYNLALLYEDAGALVRALDHYEAYLKYAAGSDATRVAAVREHCQALRQRLVPR